MDSGRVVAVKSANNRIDGCIVLDTGTVNDSQRAVGFDNESANSNFDSSVELEKSSSLLCIEADSKDSDYFAKQTFAQFITSSSVYEELPRGLTPSKVEITDSEAIHEMNVCENLSPAFEIGVESSSNSESNVYQELKPLNIDSVTSVNGFYSTDVTETVNNVLVAEIIEQSVENININNEQKTLIEKSVIQKESTKSDEDLPKNKAMCEENFTVTDEFTLDRNSVSKIEIQWFPEFFSTKTDKAYLQPKQYMLIRNLFLDEWNKRKPRPIKFREMIAIHRGIGTVISVGRVCRFLTKIGAINNDSTSSDVICTSNITNTDGLKERKRKNTHNDGNDADSPNKKTRTKKSYYLNEMVRLGIDPIASGFTIPESERENVFANFKKKDSQQNNAMKNQPLPENANTNTNVLQSANQQSLNKTECNSQNGFKDCANPLPDSNGCTQLSDSSKREECVDDTQTQNSEPENLTNVPVALEHDVFKASRTRPNPFKLIRCEKYGEETKPPFELMISVEALAIIDVHAHCVQNEVIGLLGGRFCPLLCQLHVLTAEPCESLTASTTDLQCEMDPVSQALASEKLLKGGYRVVGWYHSHPTFIPNPSLRDLETQTKYQELFAEGDQPFIALILSPYSTQSSQKNNCVSRYKCLMVSDQLNAQGDYRIPYEFSPLLVRKEKLVFNLVSRLSELCSKISGNESTLCLSEKIKGRDISYIQKLCTSLKHHLETTGLSNTESDYLLERVKQVLLQNLSQKTRQL
ncbi:histone H2A deubiquitinase MYSM1-like isoform X8 [Dinothrombium tinctorium]|uniref:Histone H2A deubiquitinase MYSM1-like isoform X8 n=1 Tax=Dinothrombium tinctorium TaxID=1965070 RepID=A0A3S3PH35_9ACAR|nr:histone H2A deubiquitinase MYSM1-like isoform X8 [Dinothrombium tinctorium]